MSIAFSLKEILFEAFNLETVGKQIDWGVTFGAIGINSKEQITHDLRLRTDLTPYKDLSNTTIISVDQERDYTIAHAGIYFDISPVDNLTFGAMARTYLDEDDKEYLITADGYTLSLFVRWFPQVPNDWF